MSDKLKLLRNPFASILSSNVCSPEQEFDDLMCSDDDAATLLKGNDLTTLVELPNHVIQHLNLETGCKLKVTVGDDLILLSKN